MKILQTLLLFMMTFCGTANNNFDFVELRNQIAEINVSLYSHAVPSQEHLVGLKTALEQLTQLNEDYYPNELCGIKNLVKRINTLNSTYTDFLSFANSSPGADTLTKVFRGINNEFNSIFGKYFHNETLSSNKKKIIIVSTSLSCEYTLEMCYKQEMEIQRLLKQNPGMVEYAVIDGYYEYELADKYQAGFMPTIIILNSKNDELKRYVREETVLTKLKENIFENEK
ncbi:MAG: hypothetical protein V1720_08820 [bacterium]